MRAWELMRKPTLLLLVLTTGALASGLETVKSEDVGLNSQRLARLSRTFQTHVDEGQIAGALVVVVSRAFNNPFAAASLFVVRDGRWKLLHGHYSLCNPR